MNFKIICSGCRVAGCPWDVPAGSGVKGIVLRRSGPNESLLRFWVRHGQKTDSVTLNSLRKRMVFMSKAPVQLYQEKKTGLKSQLCFGCINFLFDEL